MSTTMNSYACTLKGTAMLARDERDLARKQADWFGAIRRRDEDQEADRLIAIGRYHAFAAVLFHITGRRDDDGINDIIDAMN